MAMAESSKPPLARRMKARAPPPPQAPQPAPRHIFRNTVHDGGGTSAVDAKENMLRPTVDLQLTLPQGFQTSVTEDGSKALMDLLVELCSCYHLNPALHTLELLTPEGHPLGFKPNALLGSLNVACVLIKEKVWEEKVVRRPAPRVPEKTVRLMVNYHGSQKAVVRVNPLVPLQALIPVICDKCEFDPAHALFLRDSISRYELSLDKSLTELGIKELYVHNQSLVLQPKMASAPDLNYSDSIHSSTTTLWRPEKKGLFGIFQFSRRKSKTETTSMDMDDCDDKIIQNTEPQFNGLSTVSGVPSIEDRPSTLGQSQSVTTIPRMSPRSETKKRRAPAPPGAAIPVIGQASYMGCQMSLGSESQQRKRKAPAPPPTPSSVTPGFDDTSTSAAHTPDNSAVKAPTPAFRIKVAESNSASTIVVTQTTNPLHLKTAGQPPFVFAAMPTASSPTPSSSTTDSLAVQDSSSELSHSLDDSDVDLDQAGSHCSTLTSSTVSEFARVQPTVKRSSSRIEELETSSNVAAKFNQEASSGSISRSESESALNLKLDEVENNRHSGMGNTDQPAPPKPRRSPAQEPTPHVRPPILSTPLSTFPPIEPTESKSPQCLMQVEEAAAQSWLHSMQSTRQSGQKPETVTPEEETLSMGSSSGSSLPDQGYAASEEMAEGEDSGVVSSPSDTQPTSPEGSLSLDGNNRDTGERHLGPVRENSSDSDEGCATWGSRHRKCDTSSARAMTGSLKDTYENEPELTAQLHETLADFEANLAGHIGILSAKETPFTMSTDSNEVPVSIVDMDVPVTAIDEVLEDYEYNEAKSLTRTESTGRKGPDFCHQFNMEAQNKNNNACTSDDSNKSSSANAKQPSQPEQHRKSSENKDIDMDQKGKKIIETKIKVMSVTDTNTVEEVQQKTSAVKSNVDKQKHSNGGDTEVQPSPMKIKDQSCKKAPLSSTSQRSGSTERGEDVCRVFQNNSNSYSGKITHSVTSRFGMKTFTVVPPKPSVVHAATGKTAVTLTAGAIKIDDQGNMVKVGMSQNKVGGSSESRIKYSEEAPFHGKSKAFWSSNERHENAVPYRKGLIDGAKENLDGLKSTPTKMSETALKTNMTEYHRTKQNTRFRSPERAHSKDMLKEEGKESVKDIQVAKEPQGDVGNKNLVSQNVQPPSNKPAIPPPLFPDLKRDLSFLKPSRRTSSQYVASAISKYTPKPSVKPNSISTTTYVPDSSASIKTHTTGFQRSVPSIQVNPQLSSQETEFTSKPNPKRSVSHPVYVPDNQRDFVEVRLDREGFQSCVGDTKVNSDMLENETAKNNHIQCSGPIQINENANNDRDNINCIRPRSPTLVQSSLGCSSAKPPTIPKDITQGQDTQDMTRITPHVNSDVKALPSVTVSDSGVTPGPLPVTVFGPVKKFRPVICGPIEKETSLHSSLMEAIQTGGGRDRLKKLSTCMKKAPYVEEVNERSALLAAIRAQSNTDRLKKIKSVAAVELEKFRQAAFEVEKGADPPSLVPPSLTSPPIFTPPPPPLLPAPTVAPPPPPPILPPGKPSTVTDPSAKIPMNPALARAAMLDAIRSGSAAEKLKKVSVPTKTVQVNGRLGRVQAKSSTLPPQ